MIPSQFPSRFPLYCVGYAFHHTFFRWCFAGHTFHGAFHNVFRNAFRYVKLRYVRDGSVLRCIMLLRNVMWVTVSGWRRGWHYVAGGVTVTMCGLRYAGNTRWQTLCRWRYVGVGVLAYILELKLNSKVSKWIAHVSVLYNIDVTCRHGNNTTCCIMHHPTC